MKRLIAFVFFLTIFALPAHPQDLTGGKLLADCHDQIRQFNIPYSHVENGIGASILARQSYNAGSCTGAIIVGFGMILGMPGLKKSCDPKKVVDHPIEEWVEVYVKYGDAHQQKIQNLLAADAIIGAFLSSYCGTN